MLFKLVSSAIAATILSTSVLSAQSLASIGGPANLPPAGFTGQQFVDNRGCLFLRAGFGAQVNWVPRIGRDRKPLCSFPPTFGAPVAVEVAAEPAPQPNVTLPAVAPVAVAPVVVAPVVATAPAVQPAPVAAATTVAAAAAPVVAQPQAIAPRGPSFLAMLFAPRTRAVAAAPVVVAPVQPTYAAADLAGPASGQIQCFASAPRLERVLLRSGGTALVCTRGDGSLTGWRPPRFPQGAGVGAALSPQVMSGATLVGSSRSVTTGRVAATAAIPTPPPGYKLAWKDDRLNPMRGIGTAQGQAQQDHVWTRDVPAVLVADQPQPRATARTAATRTAATGAAATVTVSTMSAPQTQAAPAAAYVQVGTFGQPANADGVKARLSALGLPVSTSKITRGGKVLQIVYAGPFASTAAAQVALAQARGAGFGDAILR